MPNWVSNRIDFDNEKDLNKFLDTIRKPTKDWYGDETIPFTLNWIIPQPRNKEECPEEYIYDESKAELKIKPEENRKWFNWWKFNTENWNVKWDADPESVIIEDKTIFFETPWDSPYNAIMKMFDMFPDMNINVYYADEDYGYNCGYYFHEAGNDCIGTDEYDEVTPKSMVLAHYAWGDEDVNEEDYDNEEDY